MKPQELRKLNNNELIKMKKQLDLDLMKSQTWFGKEKVKNKYSMNKNVKQGTKTSLQRDLRKNIARINTILNERK